MRLLCGVMRQRSLHSSACASGVNSSNSGPGSTRSASAPSGSAVPQSGARRPKGRRAFWSAPRREAPSASRSPLRSARPSWPPKPALRSVLREPRMGATSMPPATASQLRRPAFGVPGVLAPASRSVWPARTGTLQQGHSGTPSSVAPKSSPASAMRVSVSNCSSQPPMVNSMPAAASALPASRFANVSASMSSAPPGQMPSWRRPGRPRSCTEACTPGLRTRIMSAGFRRRSARGRPDAARWATRPTGRTARAACAR
ncbi:hypothetical protein FQZ97_784910 [compost metagenome]